MLFSLLPFKEKEARLDLGPDILLWLTSHAAIDDRETSQFNLFLAQGMSFVESNGSPVFRELLSGRGAVGLRPQLRKQTGINISHP